MPQQARLKSETRPFAKAILVIKQEMMSMKNSLNTSVLVTADSPRGQRATETFRAQYNKAGLTKESAQILNEHPGFATYLLAGIRRFGVDASDYKMVRHILGEDFISPEEVQKHRKGIVYSEEQLIQFRSTVPSKELLKWCRDKGYILVPGPNRQMSLLEIRSLKCEYFFTSEGGWYDEQKFAKSDKVKTRWIMLRKEPVTGSYSKNWNEQKTLLSREEVTPNIAELAWCVTTYKAVHNSYLLPSVHVRTSSLNSDAHRVSIGHFSDYGLLVDGYWVDTCSESVGLSSARKQ